MLRNHGSRLTSSSNFQQLYTARFVPLFLHLVLLILIFVYRVSGRGCEEEMSVHVICSLAVF